MGRGQGEVAQLFFRIAGLLHRTEEQVVYALLFGLSPDLFQKSLENFGLNFSLDGEGVTQMFDEFLELLYFLSLRYCMHPV
jgi:hypothetical protein